MIERFEKSCFPSGVKEIHWLYLFSPETLYSIYQMQVDIFRGLQERPIGNTLGLILLYGSNIINITILVLLRI